AVARDPGTPSPVTATTLVAGPAPAAGRTDEGVRRRLEADARNEPLVRNLLETFDGQIVDIESA
ncbi:MAG: hypothetical protein ACRD6R_06545, partial [Candidatus Polarisedimenticolia bacterium]